MKLPIEYSTIFKSYDETTWYVRKNGKCGLVDADMNVIFEPIYDNIRSNPRERNAYLTANGVKQLVSFDGEVIQPFVIDEIWPLYYRANCEDSEGNMDFLHPYLVEVMVDYNCVGVMDARTGKMVIPAIYSDINMVSKNLLMAQLHGEENNIVFTESGVIVK